MGQQKCLAAAISNSNCNADDSKCTCTTTSIQEQSAVCIAGSCTVKEALFTQNATDAACGAPVRNKSPLFIDVTIVFGVISAFVVILRLGSKAFMNLGFGLDDWCILITLFCGVPSSCMNVLGTAGNGEGKDIWTLPFDMITRFGYFFWILEVLYFAQVMLLKITLLFFYLRIFPGDARKVLWATVIFDAMYGTAFIFLALFQCHPISFFWTGWDGEHKGTCLNSNAIGWANASISIALDLWMLAIPLWQIRKLKLHWKKKIGVVMMFFVGTFVTVVSIVRLQFIVNLGSSTNPTFDQVDVSIWSTVEINIGIICTCMPSLRLFLVRLFPILGDSTHNKSSYQQYGEEDGNGSKALRSRTKTSVVGGKPPSQPGHNGIELHKMFEVHYEDEDETRLVRIQEAEAIDGRSTRGANNGSEISL
ncbi:hypothetical protein ACHAQJ_003580 [Trichoderma viride]